MESTVLSLKCTIQSGIGIGNGICICIDSGIGIGVVMRIGKTRGLRSRVQNLEARRCIRSCGGIGISIATGIGMDIGIGTGLGAGIGIT